MRAPSGRCLRPLEIARFEAGRGLYDMAVPRRDDVKPWDTSKFLSLATHLLVSGTGHGRDGALAPTRHRSAGIKTRGRAGPKPTTHGGRPACWVEPAAVCGTVLVSYLGGAPPGGAVGRSRATCTGGGFLLRFKSTPSSPSRRQRRWRLILTPWH